MTTQDENKEIVHRYYKDVVEGGRTELLSDLIADDVLNHDPLSDESLTHEEARGFEGFRHHVEVFQEAFPDRTFRIEDQIVTVGREDVSDVTPGELPTQPARPAAARVVRYARLEAITPDFS
ncbi:ester cyclase [Haloprofundus salilacus]|uniref:ester cyclase n=1 Tax=Haloprofundus salilacus TaxID=2876190 RepID=UPI001CCBED57|nr:ester cyclase [Haloprofundus salilacus]